eukprot:jgi/Botrbrau1/11007/Bobra.101_1s0005.1
MADSSLLGRRLGGGISRGSIPCFTPTSSVKTRSRCSKHAPKADASFRGERLNNIRPNAALVTEPERKTVGIDWDKLAFSCEYTGPYMYKALWTPESGWQGGLEPYGPLDLLPSAQVLNYGQSVFEGMKAQRSAKDRIVLFRPDRNADRMATGAERLHMPPVPTDFFIEAVAEVVRANADYVPPMGKGSFYVRPLLMGTGPILGLGPAPHYEFVVFGAAVGAYFKTGQLTPIHLVVEERFHRSAPRGMGGTKAAGNYSPVLVSQMAAKKEGYTDVLYLDAKHDMYLEEVSSCNVFCVHDNIIRTPPAAGSILPGVTRQSIIDLAAARGYTVQEDRVSVNEAMVADEIFTSGTAVVVCSVGSLTYRGERKVFQDGEQAGPIALELYDALTSIQLERAEDPFGWVVPVT